MLPPTFSLGAAASFKQKPQDRGFSSPRLLLCLESGRPGLGGVQMCGFLTAPFSRRWAVSTGAQRYDFLPSDVPDARNNSILDNSSSSIIPDEFARNRVDRTDLSYHNE
jgi:hypothetical protein